MILLDMVTTSTLLRIRVLGVGSLPILIKFSFSLLKVERWNILYHLQDCQFVVCVEKLISYVIVTKGVISEIGKGNWTYIGVLSHAINFACTPETHESYLRLKYLTLNQVIANLVWLSILKSFSLFHNCCAIQKYVIRLFTKESFGHYNEKWNS